MCIEFCNHKYELLHPEVALCPGRGKGGQLYWAADSLQTYILFSNVLCLKKRRGPFMM